MQPINIVCKSLFTVFEGKFGHPLLFLIKNRGKPINYSAHAQ